MCDSLRRLRAADDFGRRRLTRNRTRAGPKQAASRLTTCQTARNSVAAAWSGSGLPGRRPTGGRVGQRREHRLDLRATGLERRRQDDLRAELLERHVDREAGAVVGDLEQDDARLAEGDRVEVVAGG